METPLAGPLGEAGVGWIGEARLEKEAGAKRNLAAVQLGPGTSLPTQLWCWDGSAELQEVGAGIWT